MFAGQLKAYKFFGLLQVLQSEDLEQLKRLCARVKSICTVIRFDIDVWQLLPYFTNLEAIELYGSQYRFEKYELTSLDASVPPLSKLRFVKLVGYIPRAVATWIMESGTNIERLELDMLDRAIESKSTMDDDFIRHPEDVYIPDDWLTYESTGVGHHTANNVRLPASSRKSREEERRGGKEGRARGAREY